ncbi:hypothetical protein [Actinoplanes sp. NPDC020271]|uniref:hypothetical protein n=1 Tax=Actinoplanes sp. NPDC020271 TaxID=3363896 RepID=UPI0037A317DD
MQTSGGARVPRSPSPIRAARVLLALIALSHLAVPIVMQVDRGVLHDEIASRHPGFGATAVTRSVDIAVTSAVVFHGVLLVLCAVLIGKLRTAQPWTRRLTTASQLLSVAFGAFSWSSTPMFHAVIPVIGAVQLVTVVLLWAPRSARAFFAEGIRRRAAAV